MADALTELREVITEAQMMHQLNLELIEELDITCKWLLETRIEFPNREKFVSMLNKIDALLNEIYSTHKMQYYYKVESADEKKQHSRTDGDVPVPLKAVFLCAWGLKS